MIHDPYYSPQYGETALEIIAAKDSEADLFFQWVAPAVAQMLEAGKAVPWVRAKHNAQIRCVPCRVADGGCRLLVGFPIDSRLSCCHQLRCVDSDQPLCLCLSHTAESRGSALGALFPSRCAG